MNMCFVCLFEKSYNALEKSKIMIDLTTLQAFITFTREYIKGHIFELQWEIWLTLQWSLHHCNDQAYFHIFHCSSNIMWSFIYSLVFFTMHGCIMNSRCHQLPVGLIAPLAEHYTGVTEVIGLYPVQALVSQLLNIVCITAMINRVNCRIPCHLFASHWN